MMYNIDLTLPSLFQFRDCVMGWLHCDVTCGLPWTKTKLVIIKLTSIILHIDMEDKRWLLI